MARHEFHNGERFIYMTQEETESMKNYFEVTEEQYDEFVAALEKAEADDSPKPKLEALMQREVPWAD